MSHELAPTIAEFSSGDVTVRLVGGFFGILPFVASWSPTLNLDAAALAAAAAGLARTVLQLGLTRRRAVSRLRRCAGRPGQTR